MLIEEVFSRLRIQGDLREVILKRLRVDNIIV